MWGFLAVLEDIIPRPHLVYLYFVVANAVGF